MYNREFTSERILELKPNEIFVFGSNLAGSHGGGAARLAYNRFGAIWGQGVGLQGQSYAIPTMHGGVETIKPYVDEFIEFAKLHPEYKFLTTQIGCGIAGFTAKEIAPLFENALDLPNVILPKSFVELLQYDTLRNHDTLRNRIKGSLVGGAIGDALGYPVEFLSRKNILHKYGYKGIRTFQDFDKNGKAIISDDTQMTLFTANGLLFGVTRWCTHGMMAPMKSFLAYAYQDWLQTQIGVEDYNANHYCWIRDIVELNVRRAPGNTCMSALMSLKGHQEVDNNSKGCGGVMRVAPVGLMAAADEQVYVKDWYGKDVPRHEWSVNEIVRLGGDCAEITHKHPLGYLPAAFMADLIYYILMYDEPITFSILEHFIGAVYADVKREYTTDREQKAIDELWTLIEKAISQAADITTLDEFAIPRLGEGWTGDEALAIAIYCTMKHLDSFDDAIAAAVNHDGDSDSTGAICGNLMGAIVGYDAVPQHFKQRLELRELIEDLADDIVRGCTISEYHTPKSSKEILWEKRYVKIEPVNPKSFYGVFSSNREYHFMPKAQMVLEIKELFNQLEVAERDAEKCQKGYAIALKVFDTESFEPYRPLEWKEQCHEPIEYHINRNYMPAYTYGFNEDEHKDFSKGIYRTYRLNTLCFRGKNPVVAVRKDGTLPIRNQLHGGLVPYNDKTTMEKYHGWEFYSIDPSTADGHYAFFTNQLEKEFAVEIAHLWEDGTLHRIYHLDY